jgi:hypothetical protein
MGNVGGVSSLYKKKLLALFICASMFVNGFALSVGEIKRDSIVLIAAAVTYEMITEAISKCGDSLALISNKVSERIGSFIFNGEGEGRLSGDRGEKKGEGERGEGTGKAAISEFRKNIEKARELIISAGMSVKEVLRIYGEYRAQGLDGRWLLLLAFIMFIIGIRQRKGLGETGVFTFSNNSVEKIKISA